RLDQARSLIKTVRVVTPEGADLPAFLHVRPTSIGPGYYQSVSVIAQSPDEFQIALREAKAYLASAIRAVGDLEAVSPIKRQPRVRTVRRHTERALATADTL